MKHRWTTKSVIVVGRNETSVGTSTSNVESSVLHQSKSPMTFTSPHLFFICVSITWEGWCRCDVAELSDEEKCFGRRSYRKKYLTSISNEESLVVNSLEEIKWEEREKWVFVFVAFLRNRESWFLVFFVDFLGKPIEGILVVKMTPN